MCSTLKDTVPTVSASSSPFSFPTLRANISIKYTAVAIWRVFKSDPVISELYFLRTRSIIAPNSFAVLNLTSSLLALMSDLSDSHTYFVFPVIKSFQLANQ